MTSSITAPAPALRDYTVALWLMKLGALLNFWFMFGTPSGFAAGIDPWIVWPAQFLFAVSAYRCLFPVHYEHDVVLHDSVFSSIFATRFLATIKELAFIYLMSRVLRDLNTERVAWIDITAWLMMIWVSLAECFVWGAVLLYRFRYYVYEESTWLLICIVNTIASVYLWQHADLSGGRRLLLGINFFFAAGYIPFQVVNLRYLWKNAIDNPPPGSAGKPLGQRLVEGAWRSIRAKNLRTDAESWGGPVGLLWMIGYFATFVPLWMYCIARVLTGHWIR